MLASKLVLDGKLFCIADDTISCLVWGGVCHCGPFCVQYELALALPARVLRCRCLYADGGAFTYHCGKVDLSEIPARCRLSRLCDNSAAASANKSNGKQLTQQP
jgi:hypothetical protein